MKLSSIFTGDIRPGKLFRIPDSPLNVMLDLTYFCNNRCRFCYCPEMGNTMVGTPDVDLLARIVETMAGAGTEEILYLGGEPFSHPEVLRILETGRNAGIFQRAVTNGSFLSSANYCSNLATAGLNEVGVSFSSSHEKIHDNLSGRPGAFTAAIRGVESCLAAGLNVFIQYSPNTLNEPRDLSRLEGFLSREFGREIGLFDINRLLPVGRGYEGHGLFLSEPSWFELLVEAAEISMRGKEIRVELSPPCWIEKMASERNLPQATEAAIMKMNRGCYMWVAQLPLDPQGRIKFCPAGPPLGPSILEVPWPDFWRHGEIFEKYRNFLWNKKCVNFASERICSFFYKCLGGCKYSTGTHLEVDIFSIGLDRIRHNPQNTGKGDEQ